MYFCNIILLLYIYTETNLLSDSLLQPIAKSDRNTNNTRNQ